MFGEPKNDIIVKIQIWWDDKVIGGLQGGQTCNYDACQPQKNSWTLFVTWVWLVPTIKN